MGLINGILLFWEMSSEVESERTKEYIFELIVENKYRRFIKLLNIKKSLRISFSVLRLNFHCNFRMVDKVKIVWILFSCFRFSSILVRQQPLDS